jgi:zinc/manganese transport system substrate-binding protein
VSPRFTFHRSTIVFALAMVLAACGAGGDSAPENTVDGASSTTAATETPGSIVTDESTVTTAAGADPNAEPLMVVATTSILGDVVRNIVGDSATVQVIMGIGADPHDFEASAQQVAAIQAADLVVANGLALEEGLIDIIETAEAEGTPVIELADLLDPIPFADPHGHSDEEQSDGEGHSDEDEHSDEGEQGHGDQDPHFWQDPSRMATAVDLIADQLTEIDGSIDWHVRADAYAAELTALDAEIEVLLAGIADDQRKIVTNHEAFGYFADRYRFEVIGTVIPGGSTLAEPSAADLADLVGEIEEEGVTAIFAENTNPSALAEAVAGELGTEIGVYELYSDSLGEPGSPAETYIGMIRANAATVATALG